MYGVGGKAERQLVKEKWLEDIKKFKARYGCLYCLYRNECHECFSHQKCMVADHPEIDYIVDSDRNECDGCPYGNETGTCFGFCIRAILYEHKKTMGFKNGGS